MYLQQGPASRQVCLSGWLTLQLVFARDACELAFALRASPAALQALTDSTNVRANAPRTSREAYSIVQLSAHRPKNVCSEVQTNRTRAYLWPVRRSSGMLESPEASDVRRSSSRCSRSMLAELSVVAGSDNNDL